MEYLKIVYPLGDGVSLDDISDDIKEAAEKSVKMWEDYMKSENERRIKELEFEIEKLKMQNSMAKLTMETQIPFKLFMKVREQE